MSSCDHCRMKKHKTPLRFFAIGHSTRPISEFIGLLNAHGVTILVDVRTMPRSCHNPQYDKERFSARLKRAGIKYRHLAELGGLRHTKKDSINSGWNNASFRGYADYMQTREFKAGLGRLLKLARRETAAIMCAEGNYFRCHRRLIADAAVLKGAKVLHITSRRSAKSHILTPFISFCRGRVSYPSVSGSTS